MSHPNLEILPFCRAKMVEQYIFAEQLMYAGQTSDFFSKKISSTKYLTKTTIRVIVMKFSMHNSMTTSVEVFSLPNKKPMCILLLLFLFILLWLEPDFCKNQLRQRKLKKDRGSNMERLEDLILSMVKNHQATS